MSARPAVFIAHLDKSCEAEDFALSLDELGVRYKTVYLPKRAGQTEHPGCAIVEVGSIEERDELIRLLDGAKFLGRTLRATPKRSKLSVRVA